MDIPPSSPQGILLTIAMVIWLFTPITLLFAFFICWKKIRHWGFGAMAIALLIGLAAQISISLGQNITRFGKTSDQAALAKDIPALMHIGTTLYFVMAVGLLIGAFGLLNFAKRFAA